LDGTEQQFLIEGVPVWLHPECRRFFAAELKFLLRGQVV
jgi:hypothetical protein